MTDPTIDAAVREILGAVLGRRIAPGESVRRADDSAWDSLKHMELLFAVEDRFSVQFDERELAALASLDDITHAVERHRAA